ncbi:uncharacterized protein LOC110921486 isoform X1 [Helianthus annuus]|uniref:uncharacterized protein LOC110921486 isoform X1 n=1 Tax=Helianthus annuus TaxID=4232 RepID=UPI000B8FEDDC|nr:uncharacterized protein LOC110921486 isoform X1 [Helianthus annuus]
MIESFVMLIAVLFIQEAIKGLVREFNVPKNEDSNKVKYQFQWLYANDGNICLDILPNQWSPIYDVAAILTSIQQIFITGFKVFHISSFGLFCNPKALQPSLPAPKKEALQPSMRTHDSKAHPP